jgi:PKD repeat protein
MVHIGTYWYAYENISSASENISGTSEACGSLQERWNHNFGLSFVGTLNWTGFADYTADGAPDLICEHKGGLYIKRLRQTAPFSFAYDSLIDRIFLSDIYGQHSWHNSGVLTGQVTDINCDGYEDIVMFVRNYGADCYQIRVWLYNGSGIFAYSSFNDILVEKFGPQGVSQKSCLGDFNNDGKIDVAFHCADNALRVLLWTGGVSFKLVTIVDDNGEPIDTGGNASSSTQNCPIVAGQFVQLDIPVIRGDDIVSGGLYKNGAYDYHVLYPLQNTGKTTSKGDLIFVVGELAVRGHTDDYDTLVQISAGDFNGDGLLDIVGVDRKPEGDQNGDLRIEFFMNNDVSISTAFSLDQYLVYPEDDFTLPRDPDNHDTITSITSFDYNGDGMHDIVGAHHAPSDPGGPYRDDVVFLYSADIGIIPHDQPVILVHGWHHAGDFRCSDGVQPLSGDVSHNDFGDMAYWFEDIGYDVWIANYDTGSQGTPVIEDNAQCLEEQVAEVRERTGRKVILVAHSLGGLVSRACLNSKGCRDNVAALYTMGSPHGGFNALTMANIIIPVQLIDDFLWLDCLNHPAGCQVARGMFWFNESNPNRHGVDYGFIGGRKTPFLRERLLWPSEGRNDGTIGCYSAVGWNYPWGVNAVPGPGAKRCWTDETHSQGLAYPSYFEAYPPDEPYSQAFRCIIAWLLGEQPVLADCYPASREAPSAIKEGPVLSASTVEVTGHLDNDQSENHPLQVDSSDYSLFYLSWLTGTLSFTITQPNGQVITPEYAAAHPEVVTYTMGLGDGATSSFAAYAFATTVPGLHTVTIGADDVGSDGTDYCVFAALETDRTMSIATDLDMYQAGDTAIFTGTLQGPSGGIAGANVQARLIRMDGVTETLLFNDLGSGVYGASYTVPDVPGYLGATFTAIGDDGGTAFTRQVNDLLAIAPHNAQLAGTYADRLEDGDGDGFYETLALDVGVAATEAGTYTLSADLVVAEQTVAHAVYYGILTNGTQTVTLRFDGSDIFQSQVSGPYTVTNLYLVDLGAGGIPAEMAYDVWVTAAYDWHDFGIQAGFSASPLMGTAPLMVTFANESVGVIDSYLWQFGDGESSNEREPAHNYTVEGAYTVTLTVSGPAGMDTLTRTDYINVKPSATPPTPPWGDDFEDGDASDWKVRHGKWGVKKGLYVGRSKKNERDAAPARSDHALVQDCKAGLVYRWVTRSIIKSKAMTGLVLCSDGEGEKENGYLVRDEVEAVRVYEIVDGKRHLRASFPLEPTVDTERSTYKVELSAGGVAVWRNEEYLGMWMWEDSRRQEKGKVIGLEVTGGIGYFDEVAVDSLDWSSRGAKK